MELTATEFKAKCLSLIDQVHEGGEPVVITKHGKVVAKLVGVSAAGPIKEIREKLAGSVKSYIDPFEPALSEDEIEASQVSCCATSVARYARVDLVRRISDEADSSRVGRARCARFREPTVRLGL